MRRERGWTAVAIPVVLLVVGGWALWCSVVGFVGGAMPLIGYETEGSWQLGLFVLLVVAPVALMVTCWACLLVSLGLGRVLDRTPART